jgi:threonine dehydratase
MEEMSSETVTREAIRSAHGRIAAHIRRTPVWNPAPGAFGYDGPVSLKLEFLQHAGSFNARGALICASSPRRRRLDSSAVLPCLPAAGGKHVPRASDERIPGVFG